MHEHDWWSYRFCHLVTWQWERGPRKGSMITAVHLTHTQYWQKGVWLPELGYAKQQYIFDKCIIRYILYKLREIFVHRLNNLIKELKVDFHVKKEDKDWATEELRLVLRQFSSRVCTWNLGTKLARNTCMLCTLSHFSQVCSLQPHGL